MVSPLGTALAMLSHGACPAPTTPLCVSERNAGGRPRVRRDALHMEELLTSHPPGTGALSIQGSAQSTCVVLSCMG